MAESRQRQDMAQETNQTQAPLLCSTGCGFYGNPRNNGMCSVCYRDFLQRQNSNSCVSPSGSSSSGSNIGDTELTQLSNSATVTSPAATSPTHCSGPATASATSAEDNTSGAKSSLTPDCIQSRAAAEGSKQADQSSAGSSGTNSSTQGTGRKCSHKRKKRRQENPDENRDVKRASGSEESVGSALQSEEKPKAKKNRCFTCNKKLGLTGFDCRCGNVFCSIHRYSDIHNCTFDYRAYAAEKIRKENPVVTGEKIKKI